jgi:predicted Zn-dependent protease
MMAWRRTAARACNVVAIVLGVALGVSPLTGCETNPTTGRSQAIIFSWADEVALGTQETPKMVQEFGGEVARADLREYVSRVGMSMAATTGQDDPVLGQLPWEFKLLNSPVANAFALPGGKVFMTVGLASKMTNEAQLAGVLGHEIGHVAARHANERIASGTYAQMGLAIGGALLGGSEVGQIAAQIAEQGAGFWLLSYGRDQENESDALGLRYMTRVGYDPLGQYQVMQILAKMEQQGRPPEFLSTHPYPEKRMENIAGKIQGEYAHTQGNPQFSLREAEFRANFLSKLAAAYPADQWDDADHALALASVGMGCGHTSERAAERCARPHAGN